MRDTRDVILGPDRHREPNREDPPGPLPLDRLDPYDPDLLDRASIRVSSYVPQTSKQCSNLSALCIIGWEGDGTHLALEQIRNLSADDG